MSGRNGANGEGPGWWMVIAVALFSGFVFLGSRGLGDPDEGRYAAAALEMLTAGDPLTPTLGGVPHLTKPPLAYWISAAGMFFTGPTEWGARGGTGAAHALTALVVAALGQTLAGSRRGRWAGVVYATMLTPFVAASLLTPDPLLVLFETALVLFLWRCGGAERRTLDPLLVGIFAGLAVLAKGPVGLMPLAVFAGAAPFDRSGRVARALIRGASLSGLALFGVIALPWYLFADAIHPGLLKTLVGDELIGRAVTGDHGRNSEWFQPIKIWLLPLTVGCLPWSLLWLRRSFWRGVSGAGPAETRLLVAWIAAPLAIFALLPTRQVLYVLPVFPAIALLTTLRAVGSNGSAIAERPMRALVVFWLLLLAALRGAAAEWPSGRDTRSAAAAIAVELDRAEARVVAPVKNMHGLAFYLDRPIERDAARTLIDADARVVILARESREEEIEELAAAAGRTLRSTPWRRDMRVFVAEKMNGIERSEGDEPAAP